MKIGLIIGGIVLLMLIVLGSRKAWSSMDQQTRVELNNLYYGKEFSVKESDDNGEEDK